MRGSRKRYEQVDGQRPVGSAANRSDLRAQLLGPEDADRPETSGVGDGRGELVTGQAAAHPGLDDRQLDPELL